MLNFFQKSFEKQILPAVTIDKESDALKIAEAFLNGGLNCMEITFRTNAAAAGISSIRKSLPEMYCGAGTLLHPSQVSQAIDAGAQFGLAPGYNPTVCKFAIDNNMPFIPGVLTPSEMEQAAELGLQTLKLFPAAQIGGHGYLNAIASPYKQLNLQFVPMGGIRTNNMNDYLQLDNVVAVGGSWLATNDLILSSDYEQISKNVKEAIQKTKEIS